MSPQRGNYGQTGGSGRSMGGGMAGEGGGGQKVCREWLRGAHCRFGAQCRFAHSLPQTDSAPAHGSGIDAFSTSQSQAHARQGYQGSTFPTQQPAVRSPFDNQPSGYGSVSGQSHQSHPSMEAQGVGATGNAHGLPGWRQPASTEPEQVVPYRGPQPPYAPRDSSRPPQVAQKPPSRALPSTLKSLFEPVAPPTAAAKASFVGSKVPADEAIGSEKIQGESSAGAGPITPQREDVWESSKFSSTERIPSTEPTREVCV